MNLESIFKNSNDCYFFGPGLDKSYLLNQLEFAPVWLPEDYIKFFESYRGSSIKGIEILPPAPAIVWDNALEEMVRDFRKNFPGNDTFFPIAELDEGIFVVLEQQSGGSVVCGNRNFYEQDWSVGPFGSFTKWVKSYAD